MVRPPGGGSAHRERALTLIEVIVAMVLLAIAIAIVATVVVQSIQGSSSASSGAISDAAVTRVSDRLSDDVASAMTEDRRDHRLRDPAELAAAVRRNEVPLSSDPAEAGTVVDIDDVVTATETRLQLRADVDRAPGVECVDWEARSVAQRFELVRRVARAGQACGSGGLGEQVILRSDSNAARRADGTPLIDTTPFSYRLMCHSASCPGSAAPAGEPCQPWSRGTVAAAQRRWVVGVDATIGTVTVQRASGSAAGTVRMGIRSREIGSWRRALGC